MTLRENMLRAWRFQGPERLPIAAGLPYLDWASFGYDENELEAVCLKHSILFPDYQPGEHEKQRRRAMAERPEIVADKEYIDPWGCGWKTHMDGMVGVVLRHPLKDWADFAHFHAPDPDKTDGMFPLDWEALRKTASHPARETFFFGLGLPHGHTFLRVQDLRGYENFLYDMADEDPRIDQLLDLVTDFHETLIRRYVALAPDMISIPEDLGMQTSPMLSPAQFRRYIAPRYDRLTAPIKEAGILVHEHSDGYILDLAEDLIRTGGNIINMQDLVNGIDNIARVFKGRVAIDLDIDRQGITVHGSPQDVKAHIRECVAKLGSKAGGLSLTYQPYPPTPVANIDAVFDAMETYGVKDYMYR